MKSIKDMTNVELAEYLQSHLKVKGIDVVLLGGACVSFYSNNQYISMDLDLINIYFAKISDIRESMVEIGFGVEGRYYIHPDTNFFVEFPPGPLAIGEYPIKEVERWSKREGKINGFRRFLDEMNGKETLLKAYSSSFSFAGRRGEQFSVSMNIRTICVHQGTKIHLMNNSPFLSIKHQDIKTHGLKHGIIHEKDESFFERSDTLYKELTLKRLYIMNYWLI